MRRVLVQRWRLGRLLTLALACLGWLLVACAAAPEKSELPHRQEAAAHANAEAWRATALDGAPWTIADAAQGSEPQGLNALVFVAADCPIANRYAPRLNQLANAYGGRGVRFFAVYDAAVHEPKDIERHLGAFSLAATPLRDDGSLRQLAGVAVTPEVAVVSSAGELFYRGRIDDWYEDFGKRRPRASQHDLEQALDLALAGRKTPQPWPRAVGCSLTSDPRAAP